MLYSLLRPWLFKCDPEWSHDFSLAQLKRFQRTPLAWLWRQTVAEKPVEVMGLRFPNPVGLAAGLDKNGDCIDAFAQMGFGFVEVGTVTPRPQPGNPKPRMFRLPEANALINRMGFNNKGVDYLVKQVAKARFRGILGINIGKNKDTPESEALADYLECLRKVYPLASYVTINISSPNTPGLRDLQHGEALDQLLAGLKAEQVTLSKHYQRYVPIVVKIAPDLDDIGLQAIAESLLKHKIDGVIATNTTLDRDAVAGIEHADEQGGLSGAVLAERSTQVVKQLYQLVGEAIPIIAVGGIHDVASAQAKIAAGAKLVQIYTGFIYEGPKLIKRVVNAL